MATSGLFALIIGVLAWSPFGHPVFAAGMLLPIGLYSSGRSVVVSQGAYYLGSLWPMPWVVVKFYGLSGYLGWTYGVAALVSWVAILTVGFAIAWVATKWLGAMRPAVCLALTAVPPVGWLALAHPLHAAGWIFPGLAWVGLAAAFCLSALPSLRNQYGRVFVGVFSVVLAVVSNLLARQPEAPSGWRSFEVPTGPIPIDSRTAYTQIGQVRDLIKSVQRDHTKVVVLPEAVVGKWSARTDYWLNSPSLRMR